MSSLQVIAVEGMGEVVEGDDVASLIVDATPLRSGDVVVVASKVISKAEGRTIAVDDGEDLEAARRRLALRDEVLVYTPGVIVVRTRQGHVCANAGIDASNVPGGGLLPLPVDPDASALLLRRNIELLTGHQVGVIITDTFGRAWREGQTDIALGVAGLPALRDERGTTDRDGQVLRVTLIALADQLAGAADLVRHKAAGIPVVLIRGLDGVGDADHPGGGAALVRPPATDLFPHGRGWLSRRYATGDGQPVRDGRPTVEEWAQVLAIAPTARRGDLAVTLDDGLAAGRVEAGLLDLGYDVSVEPTADATAWTVQVHVPPRPRLDPAADD